MAFDFGHAIAVRFHLSSNKSLSIKKLFGELVFIAPICQLD